MLAAIRRAIGRPGSGPIHVIAVRLPRRVPSAPCGTIAKVRVQGLDDLPLEWQRAAAVLSDGRVVAAPTDTVFGLLCDPRLDGAVERIYAIKQRPAGLELNLLAGAYDDLEPFVAFDDRARVLAERFWPGPLSLVLPATAPRGHLAIPRTGDTLMVRVPRHDPLRALLAITGPAASTSANRHGVAPATTATAVHEQLGNEVDLIVDGASGGQTASTIIDCTVQPPRVLRRGPLGDDELAPYIG